MKADFLKVVDCVPPEPDPPIAAAPVVAIPIEEESPFIEQDGLIIDRETGDVVGEVGEIPLDANIEEQLEFYGQACTETEARLAALQTEFNTIVQSLEHRFGPQMREQERRLAWLDFTFAERAQQYGKEKVALQKKAKSVKLKWLTLGFESEREKLEVLDHDEAFKYAVKENLLETVKVTFDLSKTASPGSRMKLAAEAYSWLRTAKPDEPKGVKIEVRTGAIPAEKRASLPSAFEYRPGGEQRFYVKGAGKKRFVREPSPIAHSASLDEVEPEEENVLE